MCFTDSKTCLNFEESIKIIISFQNLVCVAFFNTLLPSKQNWKLVPLFLLYCALMTNSKVLSKTALSYEKEGTKQLYYLMREIEACILLPGIYKRKKWNMHILKWSIFMPLAVNIEVIKKNHLAYSCIYTHTYSSTCTV